MEKPVLIFGLAVCLLILLSGVRKWMDRETGWNGKRAKLRFCLAPANGALLLLAYCTASETAARVFYLVFVISGLTLYLQEQSYRRQGK